MRIPICNCVIFTMLFLSLSACAATQGEELYSRLEHHLQSISALEIRYTVSGTAVGDNQTDGRMVWKKPDMFYHDTPEWTLCEVGDEEWRFLKSQNTLILERSLDREQWTPGTLLLNLRINLRPVSLETDEAGNQSLYLRSDDAGAPQDIVLKFESVRETPVALSVRQVDGTVMEYRIEMWNEAVEIDPSLFDAPDVSPENLIDFRTAQSDR